MAIPSVLTRVPQIPRMVERRRLIEAVLDPSARAVLLEGPEGSGKTTLAAAAAHDAGTRLAWVRMAPGFDTAFDLVAITAVALAAPAPAEGRTLLELSGDLLELLEQQPTMLVVDDYQLAIGEECDPLLAEIVPLLAPECRVVVCSRTRPAGFVGRLPAGTVRVIDAAELAFDRDEAEGLFALAGRTGEGAAAWETTGGWAVGVAAAAEMPVPGDVDAFVRDVLVPRLDPDAQRVLRALAVLPYLTPELVDALSLGTESILVSLAAQTRLVGEHAGYWELDGVARVALASTATGEEARAWRERASGVLMDNDPPAAIDLALDAGLPEQAADVLARHVSEIGVRRAVHWLYKLPPELRHRFPPVVAFGKATVNLDAAVADAARRVDEAPTDAIRREALFALGSAHAHAGALDAAAGALEAAAGPEAPPALAQRARTWLALVRWWAGDLAGAEAAARDAGDDALACWARAEIALANGDTTRAAECGEAALRAAEVSAAEITTAPAHALLARVALLAGDVETAATRADNAYGIGVAAGGFDLGASAPAQAWVLLNQGRTDEADAVADLLRRQVGRHDTLARVQAALIRLAVAQTRGDSRADVERAATRVRDLRQLGYAPIETQARLLVPALAGDARAKELRVRLLGPAAIEAGDRTLTRRDWKSHKAFEVACYLAVAGGRGRAREEVIEAIWPERDPEKGRTLLRTALSEIRRTLEPMRPAGEPSAYLDASADRVTLAATTDVDEARALVASGDVPGALARFRGAFFEDDPYAEWANDDRRATETMRCELAERVAGDPAAAPDARIAALESLIAVEPWRSEHYTRLAALHRELGDETAARSAERRRDFEE